MKTSMSRRTSINKLTRSKTLISISVITLTSLGFLAVVSALSPEPASAQTYSVPIRWCVVANDTNGNGRVDPGEQGAPAFTNPGIVGEPDTDNVLWRRHERPSDRVFIPEAQITFRSGIYNIVEDPILRFPIIADPDPNPTGDPFWLIGDIVHPNDSSFEWNAAYNACVAAWRDQHGVEDIGIVVVSANNVRTLSGDSEPGVAPLGGRRVLIRDNAYVFPGSPLNTFPVADSVDKHLGHEIGHALGGLRHTCNNQNLMSNRRLDPSGDGLADNFHLSSSIAEVISPGADGRDCGIGNDQMVPPGADDTTAVVNQIQLLRDAARMTPGCKIAGTNTDCTNRSDVRTDRIREVPVAFTDLSTVTATNVAEIVKLFHEPMGPLDRSKFKAGGYYDYFIFIDQDQNDGTGGKAGDLGVNIPFQGAEFATRVRVRLEGTRFVITPTVWRFTGGNFVEVQDQRIRAYAFALIAPSERRTAHLTDQITIEVPHSIFGAAINNFRLQAAIVSFSEGTTAVLDLLDEDEQRPGKFYRWRSPTFPVCSVTPGASPRGAPIVVKSTGLLPNRPVHLIFGDRHIANGNAAADGSVTISTAIPADARGGEHLITVGTDGTALTADCTTTVITQDQQPPGGRCTSCRTESRYSLAFFAGATLPHGSFDTIADSSFSFGIKPAFHFPAFGGDASLGFYFGRDNFSNSGPGDDFHLTHFSPEFEFTPIRRFCPAPSLHIGAGAYRNENDDFAFGFNVGASISACINRRVSLIWRYDFRSVDDFSRNYSTVQGGVRFHF